MVKLRLDIADQGRQALLESCAEHIKFLLWPVANPSIQRNQDSIL